MPVPLKGPPIRIERFASDPSRRASKRQKDLADIARLLEEHPALRDLVPRSLLERLIE